MRHESKVEQNLILTVDLEGERSQTTAAADQERCPSARPHHLQ